MFGFEIWLAYIYHTHYYLTGIVRIIVTVSQPLQSLVSSQQFQIPFNREIKHEQGK